jgi:hypothetical protein
MPARTPAVRPTKGPATRFAAIRDPSLRLAVVEVLARARKLSLGDVPAASRQTRLNLPTLRALLTLDVPDSALAGITELWWEGGGHKIQHQIWPLWHGEDDTFFVHSLAGIEALTGLKKLTLATDADLAPLLQLGALESAFLQVAGGQLVRSAATLRDLEARGVKLKLEDRDLTPKARSPLKLP